MVSFLIDAALAVLLVTATVYLVLVNKRLTLLRTGQSDINALVTSFSRSIDETDASMKRLVASATETASRLAEDLDRAKGVREDMTLILGSCERTATRMEESLQHARALLRRLDEGAMRPARPRPAGIPMEELMAAAETPPAAKRAEPVETPSDATQESGEFRPLGLPQRADAPDAVPAPSPKPAPSPVATPAVATATSATPPAEPPRPMAVGAFYARLRTVGSEG